MSIADVVNRVGSGRVMFLLYAPFLEDDFARGSSETCDVPPGVDNGYCLVWTVGKVFRL